MSSYRRQMGALAVGAMIVLVAEHASAQYCDPRYHPSCRAYPPQSAPPSFWPFGGVRSREMAPPPEPAPAPRYEPLRPGAVTRPLDPALAGQYAALYAPVSGEPYPLPAVRLSDIDPEYLRKSVYYPSNEPPGTIIVDAHNRFLYFVQGGGRAIRYGVGVGRQGFGWSGVATVHDKQQWPDWYPPREMLARKPEIRRSMTALENGALGMPGGPNNPLGACALYLYQNNRDTLYRIHGTNEPWTIGTNVSSGCIRLTNADVTDLYDRVAVGSKVVVLS